MTSVKLINHSSSTADWNYYEKNTEYNRYFLSVDNSFHWMPEFYGGRNGNVPANKGTIKFRYALLLV